MSWVTHKRETLLQGLMLRSYLFQYEVIFFFTVILSTACFIGACMHIYNHQVHWWVGHIILMEIDVGQESKTLYVSIQLTLHVNAHTPFRHEAHTFKAYPYSSSFHRIFRSTMLVIINLFIFQLFAFMLKGTLALLFMYYHSRLVMCWSYFMLRFGTDADHVNFRFVSP